MTTYDVASASRRALKTLVDSLHFKDGFPPKTTVSLGTTEEQLAARLTQRLGLQPRIDVEKLALSLATVTTKRFPIPVDGLCLDLKVPGKRPKIWIAHNLSHVRRRFTLAHEIGHIIIPWHSGMIMDDLDAPRQVGEGAYREMEAEANRFASELLMPTAWVHETMKRMPHPTALMNHIVNVAEVSFPAAFLRVLKASPAGFIGAAVRENVVVMSGRTHGTKAKAPLEGSLFDEMETLALDEPKQLQHGSTTFYWWKVTDDAPTPPNPEEPWRHILDRILLGLPEDKRTITKSRVNAVLGSAFGKASRATAVDVFYNHALQATQNRADRDASLRYVFNHPEFSSYLVARCYAQAER